MSLVLLAGVAVGAVAYHSGIAAGTLVVLAAASTVALLDAWGIRRAATSAPSAGGDHSDGLAADLPRVWRLMIRDTFDVSLVVIGLVGGVTYMLLTMVFRSGLFAPHG